MLVQHAPRAPRLRLLAGGARRNARPNDAAALLRDELRSTRAAAALAGASVAALAWAGARLPLDPSLVGIALTAIIFQAALGAPTRGRARHGAASHTLTCAAFVAFGLPAAIIIAALRGAFAGVGRATRDPATVLASLGAGTLAATGAGALASAAAGAGASPILSGAIFVAVSAAAEVILAVLATRRSGAAGQPSIVRRAAFYCALLAAFGVAGAALGAALSVGAWPALAAFAAMPLALLLRDRSPGDAGEQNRTRLVSVELRRIARLREV